MLFPRAKLFSGRNGIAVNGDCCKRLGGETVRAVFRTVKVGCGCHMSCWMREAGIIVLVACVTSFLFILHLPALILGWGWGWWWWGLRAVPRCNVCESAANCLHATELHRPSQESSVPSWSIIRFRACVLSVDHLRSESERFVILLVKIT